MELSVAPRELTPSAPLADVVPRYLAAMPIGDAAQERLRAKVMDGVDAVHHARAQPRLRRVADRHRGEIARDDIG